MLGSLHLEKSFQKTAFFGAHFWLHFCTPILQHYVAWYHYVLWKGVKLWTAWVSHCLFVILHFEVVVRYQFWKLWRDINVYALGPRLSFLTSAIAAPHERLPPFPSFSHFARKHPKLTPDCLSHSGFRRLRESDDSRRALKLFRISDPLFETSYGQDQAFVSCVITQTCTGNLTARAETSAVWNSSGLSRVLTHKLRWRMFQCCRKSIEDAASQFASNEANTIDSMQQSNSSKGAFSGRCSKTSFSLRLPLQGTYWIWICSISKTKHFYTQIVLCVTAK